MRKVKKENIKIKSLFALFTEYKKYIGMFAIITSILIGFYVYTQKDFYLYIEYKILSYDEKIKYDVRDTSYYETIVYDSFCHLRTFNIYMHFEPITNRLKIEKACKDIEKRYYKIDDERFTKKN